MRREWADKAHLDNKRLTKYMTRCGAAGSARALGARHRPQGIPKQKTPKTLTNTDFFGTILSRKNPILSGLTTDLTTYRKQSKNLIIGM